MRASETLWRVCRNGQTRFATVTQKSAQTLYDQIGKDRLAELVKVFYDIVETDPTDGAAIHKLHTGHPIKHTRVAQLEFLTGFLGGPKYYRERTGHFDLCYIHERVVVVIMPKTPGLYAWIGVRDDEWDSYRVLSLA